MTTYTEEDAEFHGDAGHIVGRAVYSTTWVCGSLDHIELLRVEIDGLRLTRDQIELVIGRDALDRAEDIAAEAAIAENPAWGAAYDRAHEERIAAE